MNLTYKDIVYRKYEDFSVEGNSERKKLLKLEIEKILKEQEGLDSQDYYVWGLTLYMDNKDENSIPFAHEKFRKSVDLDPKNFMARLYSAHCYQDQGQFKEALNEYLKVDLSRLKQEFPIWRYITLREQMGFCYYQLGKTDTGEMYFKEVLKYYRMLPEDETVSPVEMLKCLPYGHELAVEMRKLVD